MAIALSGCAAAGRSAAPWTVPPAPAPTAALPPGLTAIWTVSGSTDKPPLHRTTYFNDVGAPRMRAGDVWVAWSCSGGGILAVGPIFVPGTGAVPPPSITAELAFTLACPTSGDEAALTWKRLPRPALGVENALTVSPAIQPMGPVQFRIVLLQRS